MSRLTTFRRMFPEIAFLEASVFPIFDLALLGGKNILYKASNSSKQHLTTLPTGSSASPKETQ